MVLANKLNIANQIELNKAEEKISKQKAKQLFESGDINQIEIGTFKGLAKINKATAHGSASTTTQRKPSSIRSL